MIKASFTLATPNLTGLDWSFMPEISGETQVDDGDGAVIGDGATEHAVTKQADSLSKQ